MARILWMVGCLAAFVGVALGAFGAHGLRDRLPSSLMAIYETGVRYQVYHALAVLFSAWLVERSGGGPARWAGWLFLLGIVLFSGSLYLMSVSGMTALGVITPIGGAAFLAGWTMLALGWRNEKMDRDVTGR